MLVWVGMEDDVGIAVSFGWVDRLAGGVISTDIGLHADIQSMMKHIRIAVV
jgi:hypothetical protein